MLLSAAGLEVTVPPGWDAEIAGNPAVGHPSLLHLSNRPLPPGRSDFGGHALEALANDAVFVALLEYAPSDAGHGLFHRSGKPTVVPAEFSAKKLNKAITGHVGTQRFFTEAARAFCLYAVIASDARVTAGASLVNQAIGLVSVRSAGSRLD